MLTIASIYINTNQIETTVPNCVYFFGFIIIKAPIPKRKEKITPFHNIYTLNIYINVKLLSTQLKPRKSDSHIIKKITGLRPQQELPRQWSTAARRAQTSLLQHHLHSHKHIKHIICMHLCIALYY